MNNSSKKVLISETFFFFLFFFFFFFFLLLLFLKMSLHFIQIIFHLAFHLNGRQAIFSEGNSRIYLKSIFETFQKWGPSERKEFAPKGSKFFPFRVAPHGKGRKCFHVLVISLKSVHIPLNFTS